MCAELSGAATQATAIWNFPAGSRGSLDLVFQLSRGFGGANISLSDFLTVFAARTRKPFFSRMPGGLLFGAATVALGTSTLFSAYWPFPELKPLEWSLLGVVRTQRNCLLHHVLSV